MQGCYSREMVLLAVFYLLISYSMGQDLTYRIKEELSPNYFIGNIVNDSKFLEKNNTEKVDRENIRLNILSQGNPLAVYFSINDKSGAFYTNSTLDRESLSHCKFSEICEIRLDVSAQSTIGTFFKIIKVKVVVLDINDNKPFFVKNKTNLEISESSIPNSSLSVEGAVDLDSGVNTIQTYKLKPTDSPFVLSYDTSLVGSSSLKLLLNRTLDREKVSSYNLVIEAIDGGNPAKTGSLLAFISVTDVNDNRPTFSQPIYNITIDENVRVNSVILNMSATDKDLGKNGEVVYRLSPYQSDHIKQMFSINETHGNLSLIKPLTYYSGEVLKVVIEASDNADQPLISQATVNARVLDSTNSPPIINVNLLSNAGTAKIAESASIGAAVAHVGVTDEDTGQNGHVTCSVDSSNFRLHKLDVNEYKVVVNVELDREKIDTYDITVTCSDSGTPPLNSSSTFQVTVIDMNDHSPIFLKTTYYAEMYENNNIGIEILKVSALDFDIGINADIEYSLSQTGRFAFAIDPTFGTIYANFKTDRENASEINFKVVATDKGTPRRSSTSNISIKILDTNDNKPRFTDPLFTYTIPENQRPGLFVGQLTAKDGDLGNNGTFDFILSKDNEPDLPFFISKNGTITTTEALDREKHPHGINFKVVAIDKGTPTSLNSTGYVTVFMSDVNDNYPEIIFPNAENKTIAFLFDLPINSIIGKVNARDQDYDINAKLSYSFIETITFISMDQDSGTMKLNRPLTSDFVNRYPMTVVVEDHGVPKLSSNFSMTVVILSHHIPSPVSPRKAENDNYMMIAVVISCVTVVVAGSIILVIFLIRRSDQQKRALEKNNNGAIVSKNQNTLNDTKEQYDAVHHAMKREKSEKRVSFSTDDEKKYDTLEMERHLYQKNPPKQEVDRILDTIMPPPNPRVAQVKAVPSPSKYNPQPSSQIGKLQLHQNIISMHASQMQPHCDNDSETSMESNTSDSGRGGSESDIHSSGGLSQCQELDLLKQLYPRDSNQEHYRLKNTAGNVVNLRDIRPKLKENSRNVPMDNVHRKYADRRVNQYGDPVDIHNIPFSAYKPKRFTHFNSVSDILDGSMMTNDDDDDLSTTTSGSYTVDDLDDDSLHPECVV
ncbi:putative protocadherin beta-18 [Saccostrea echinata]|uniref:putative protocadherin beta-18 n=1 Tax=Saccostrea echinata TaxID=191078 RepID=UPI002A80665D|nr:putative protocadherin beta-18 [Saccostrea echinata]